MTLDVGDWEGKDLVRPYRVRIGWATWSGSRRASVRDEIDRARAWARQHYRDRRTAWLFFMGAQRPDDPAVFEVEDAKLLCALTDGDAEWRTGAPP